MKLKEQNRYPLSLKRQKLLNAKLDFHGRKCSWSLMESSQKIRPTCQCQSSNDMITMLHYDMKLEHSKRQTNFKGKMNSEKLQNLAYFTGDHLKALAQNRITTITEFLHEDVEKLSTLTNLAFPQILEIRKDIFSKYSAPLISGSVLFARGLTCRKYIATGIASLDFILDGGIPVGHISEICGLAGCGKSQLCMQLAVNCARNLNGTVLYIDTKGDFSAIRVQKILDANNLSHKDMAMIMTKIKVIRIWHMEDLLKFFESIKTKESMFENLSLIIIDSLPTLVLQHFGDNSKYGLIYLNKMVNLSRYISKEQSVGFVCVNIQTRWIDPEIQNNDVDNMSTCEKDCGTAEKRNRGLGKYWHHIPALLILLEKMNDPNSDNDSSYYNVSVENNVSPLFVKNCHLKINLLGVT